MNDNSNVDSREPLPLPCLPTTFKILDAGREIARISPEGQISIASDASPAELGIALNYALRELWNRRELESRGSSSSLLPPPTSDELRDAVKALPGFRCALDNHDEAEMFREDPKRSGYGDYGWIRRDEVLRVIGSQPPSDATEGWWRAEAKRTLESLCQEDSFVIERVVSRVIALRPKGQEHPPQSLGEIPANRREAEAIAGGLSALGFKASVVEVPSSEAVSPEETDDTKRLDWPDKWVVRVGLDDTGVCELAWVDANGNESKIPEADLYERYENVRKAIDAAMGRAASPRERPEKAGGPGGGAN